MEQVPPIFSAKKIGGVPAHKLARAGKDVQVKPAKIFIHSFMLTSLESDTASFEMKISAGGYVRSVAHELGELAGCGAHLSSLRRTRAGAFSLAQAITVDQLKALAGDEAAIEALLPHLALDACGDALGDGRRSSGRQVAQRNADQPARVFERSADQGLPPARRNCSRSQKESRAHSRSPSL